MPNPDDPPSPPETALLAADVVGAGPRIVAVHGFTQTRGCWGPIAVDLRRDHELVLVDAPGHGRAARVQADLPTGARQIVARGGRGTYLGYSMGGRFALRAALDQPSDVRRLVLVGASPGIADADERERRRRADDALADRIEAVGVAAFLDEWLALPLFAGLAPEMQFVDARRENDAAGLASSLRLAGTGAQEPLWDRLGELGARALAVLLVTGERDTKFTAIARQMAAAIGASATHAVLPGAGHTAHLEAPDAFLATLHTWLADHPID